MENRQTVVNYYLLKVEVDMVNDGQIMRTPQGQITLPLEIHEKEAKIYPIGKGLGESIEKVFSDD